MRSEGIAFRTERSGAGWISTSTSGEGLLQTFEGSGYVWLAPTQDIYERLATEEGLRTLAGPPGSSHTETDSS